MGQVQCVMNEFTENTTHEIELTAVYSNCIQHTHTHFLLLVFRKEWYIAVSYFVIIILLLHACRHVCLNHSPLPPPYYPIIFIMACIYQTVRVSVGLTCHQSRPFTMASCSRDSTVRLWSLTPLISPLLLNILTDQPWEKIIGNTGKNRLLIFSIL